jgi:hypothetical protein
MIDSMDAQAEAHLQLSCVTLAACLRMELTNGQVFGFTNYSRDITLNGVVYSSTAGQTVTAVQTTSGVSVDSVDVETLKDMTGIPVSSVLAGLFDNAEFYFFIVNYMDLTQNFGTLRRGTLGQITTERNKYTIELRGMMEQFKKRILDLYAAQCVVDLGGERCKVQVDPPTWLASTAYALRVTGQAGTGGVVKPTTPNRRHFKITVAGTSDASEPTWDTVIGNSTVDGTATWETIQALILTGIVQTVSTANKRIFIDNTLLEDDDFYLGGLLTWTSGLNVNKSFEVKRHETVMGNIEIELVLPVFNPMVIGDTYTIQAGCLKRKDEDCIARFDNIVNFQGFPQIPQSFVIVPGHIEGKN